MTAPVPTAGAGRPWLSVLTVARGNRAGLIQTRDSLREQVGGGAWEWVVVDGGSTDGTVPWLSEQAADLPAVRWCSASDRGPYDGMNRAMDRARGVWLLFLNAGDRLAGPDTLARLAAVAATAPSAAGLLYGDALERLAGGAVVRKPARSHRTAVWGMFTHHQAMLYRHAVVAGLRYDLRFAIGADYAFTVQVLRRSGEPVRFAFPVCVFAPGGLSQRDPATGRADLQAIRREYLGLNPTVCAAIKGLQFLVFFLRRHFPALYAKGRFHTSVTTFRL
ncbi:putative colanic acid biosynthesis glycosyltransferase [Azospirillum fermentarium]|uniref:glycosyltransferase n=1 Tax=Azospirillum fermentarium TaxID=1233114 RepID=UPI002226F23E|nr:glycosyltransferase [Azospirillum fermentarium]MCW2247527.1 putative colanic acid biosynthesis glycosyltransferase [Azospirillum fermentarium]